MNINGSVALVTGGASGLGEATVREYVARGGRAMIVDLNAERGEQLASELGEAAAFAKADVSDPETFLPDPSRGVEQPLAPLLLGIALVLLLMELWLRQVRRR